MSIWRAVAAAAVGARVARSVTLRGDAALSGQPSWIRTNYAGREVTLAGGPAVTGGVLLATWLVAPRDRAARAVATAAGVASVVGRIDDIAGSSDARGLRGHLGALGRGQLTTGTVKIAGLFATGVAAGTVLGVRKRDLPVTAAAVAVGANVANLFDLRPGRALKVGLVATAPALSGPALVPAAAIAGSAAGTLPRDLGERVMLGDSGAAALGAAVATAVIAGGGQRAAGRVLAAAAALTLLSELVSFSRVIDALPPLRTFDQWGRRSDAGEQ